MRRYLSTLVYFLFVVVGSLAFLAIAGIRVGLIEPITGFLLIKATVIASVVLCILSIFCVTGIEKKCRFDVKRFYIICIVISFTYSFLWIGFYFTKNQLPNVSDITTDLSQPLMFIRVSDVRKNEGDVQIVYPPQFIELQQQYYPEIHPLFLQDSPQDVFLKVVNLVDQRGWDVVSLYPHEGVIEATVTTPIFWFIDDVIIRVQSIENGSKVDMRSSSRLGCCDHGVNADRVKSFMADVEENFTLMNTKPTINR